MWRFLIVSIASGLLFAVLDGLVNANPLAQRLYAIYRPIARKSVNVTAGILIDLCYGFALAGLFLLLHGSLPGSAGWLEGLGFGLVVWFLRVVMYSLSNWMMLDVPLAAVGYSLASGLAEMLLLGLLYGLALWP